MRLTATRLPGLELICADVAAVDLPPRSLNLFHAALVLEYVSPEMVVGKAAAWLVPSGILSVLVQLPSQRGQVSDTPFVSLKSLDGFMKLVDPGDLAAIATRSGFAAVRSYTVTWVGGKSFLAAIYRLEGTRNEQ